MNLQIDTLASLAPNYYYIFDLLPSVNECINILLFVIIFFGFILIVLKNNKYQYISEYLLNKFSRWF